MNHNNQTLMGMSVNSLKEHYKQVKESYLEGGRNDRMMVYLMKIDSYVQMAEQEDNAAAEKEEDEEDEVG